MKYCVCANLVCICKKVDLGSLYYTTFPESSITIALNSFSSRLFFSLCCVILSIFLYLLILYDLLCLVIYIQMALSTSLEGLVCVGDSTV